MNSPLRILHLEDSPTDHELIRTMLRKAGLACDFAHAMDRADYEANLARGGFDLILADYSLPGYDGMTALAAVRNQHPDTPFIFVSGSIGEERAVESLKHGATDYILKDHLERLPTAIQRALREVKEHRQREELEARLQQARKLETIGQFAGGMAHDFNNLLTVILGRVSFLLDEEPLSPRTAESLKQVYTAGDHAAKLIHQWLLFSRKHPPLRETANLNTIVEGIVELLRPLLGSPVALTLEPAFPPPWVLADRGMIEQVLMNLALNARDAMPGGGRLLIRTGTLRRCAPGDPAERPGDFAFLSVRDTGHGISPDIRPHIFEPFFTTKPEGRGTGLGLAMVMDIAKRHEGWIEMDSQPGEGTTFTLFLPSTPPEMEPAPSAPSAPRTGAGHETVLVVEDDFNVREFASAVLQRSGYTVLQAKSGDQALTVWRRHAPKISLLLTDVVLPGDLSGLDLAARLLSEKPGLKVVIVSGSPGVMTAGAAALPSSVHTLSKPYLPKILAQTIRTALDEPPAS